MMKYTITVMIICFLGSVANAETNYSDKPIIDDHFKKVEIELDSVQKKCMKNEKNVIKKMDCGNELRAKYEKQGKIRGTKEYCRKNYENLTFSELREIRNGLSQQRRKARRNPLEREIGEVTESDFMTEQFWVEEKLSGMQRSKIKEDEKKMNVIDVFKSKK